MWDLGIDSESAAAHLEVHRKLRSAPQYGAFAIHQVKIFQDVAIPSQKRYGIASVIWREQLEQLTRNKDDELFKKG